MNYRLSHASIGAIRGNRNVLYGDVILFTFACWLAKGKLSALASRHKGYIYIVRVDSMYVVV
jgi:hypothetical protein